MRTRQWINQPSTHQPFHTMHGQRVIYISDYTHNTVIVAPISGSAETMVIPSACLSPGWPETNQPATPTTQQETHDVQAQTV